MPDMFFDTSLIPSLPSVGGKVDHAQLMGLGRVQPQPQLQQNGQQPASLHVPRPQLQRGQPQPRHDSQSDAYSTVRPGDVPWGGGGVRPGNCFAPQPNVRSPPHPGAVGPGSVYGPGGRLVAPARGHSRNVSAGSADTVRERGRESLDHKWQFPQDEAHKGHSTSHGYDDTIGPAMVRKTTSYGHPPIRPLAEDGRAIKHSRTWSGSGPGQGGHNPQAQAHVHAGHGRSQSQSQYHSHNYYQETSQGQTLASRGASQYTFPPPRSASLLAQYEQTNNGIFLGSDSPEDVHALIKLLATLDSLTPFDRVPDPPPPPPSSCILHPFSLLTPMAIILELLVCQRSVLKGVPPRHPLPVLRGGKQYQLVHRTFAESDTDGVPEKGKERREELDWTIVREYILSLGSILDSLLPYIRDRSHTSRHSSQGTSETSPSECEREANANTERIGELTSSVRAYVGKMKKVFGEVACMYVDQYSFVRGWWDDEEMKGAAAEVGRWGDLFEA